MKEMIYMAEQVLVQFRADKELKEAANISEMSLEEINAEISDARIERKK